MAIIRRDLGAGHHFLYDDTLMDNPTLDMFDKNFWRRENSVIGQAKGRGTTLFIEYNQHHWVLRHFKRGGLIGKLLNDQYLFLGVDRSRPFEEFQLLNHMREHGLRVPKPVGAHIHRRGLIYQGNLITQNIPNSEDLHHILTRQPLTLESWRNVGQAIAKMHQCQVYHHDANIRNIMIDNLDNVWLIDFDRCHKRNGNSWKKDNLARLLRSLKKEKKKNTHFYWNEEDWQHCIEGYHSNQIASV